MTEVVTRAKLPSWVTTQRDKSLRDLRLEATGWALVRAEAIVAEHGMRSEVLDDLIRYRDQLAREAE